MTWPNSTTSTSEWFEREAYAKRCGWRRMGRILHQTLGDVRMGRSLHQTLGDVCAFWDEDIDTIASWAFVLSLIVISLFIVAADRSAIIRRVGVIHYILVWGMDWALFSFSNPSDRSRIGTWLDPGRNFRKRSEPVPILHLCLLMDGHKNTFTTSTCGWRGLLLWPDQILQQKKYSWFWLW